MLDAIFRLGTALTIITVAALVGYLIWLAQDDEARTQWGAYQQERREIVETYQPTGLDRSRDLYIETLMVFLRDWQLDADECRTLEELAEPLGRLIEQHRQDDRFDAEHAERMVEKAEHFCAEGVAGAA